MYCCIVEDASEASVFRGEMDWEAGHSCTSLHKVTEKTKEFKYNLIK